MGLFIKICGLASREDARAVMAMKPDAVGFVFWPKSKRAVEAEAVRDWLRTAPAGLLKVGVFVDASPAEVAEVIQTAGLDIAQLHGKEAPADFATLPVPVWKAVHAATMPAALASAWPVDAFLVDTYSALSPGGTGQVGDWEAARAFVAASRTRTLLAGGLSAANVLQAVRAVRPWGVDVSSGVEEKPGRKNLRLVEEFIQKCRSL